MSSDRRLLAETRAAEYLRGELMLLTDDPEAIKDTIDGATNLHSAIECAVAALDEDEMLIDAIERKTAELSIRLDRLQRRAEKRREALAKALEIGEIRRLQLPSGTLSLKATPQKLDVRSESEVPREYFEPQPDKLNRSTLKEDLKSGKTVAGAALSNGGITIAIRRS